MSEGRKYTAFCGLYCLDCLPSNRRLFELVSELGDLLKELEVEKYARFKAKKYEVFGQYGVFVRVLGELNRLKCSGSCFEGPRSDAGCTPDCEKRSCVIEKGYQGCWECDESAVCRLLEPLKAFHPGLETNLTMIRQYGMENWAEKRGKHYPWSE